MSQSKDWVGFIRIMDIKDEPEYVHDLKNWIRIDGIDEVFKKVIRMYSLSLS